MATISWCRWSTQRPSTETTKRALKCRPSVGAAGSQSVVSRAVCRPRGAVLVADEGKRRGGVPVTVQSAILTNMKAGYPGPAHVDRRGRASNRSKLHLNVETSMGMGMDVDMGMDANTGTRWMGWDDGWNAEGRHVSAGVLLAVLAARPSGNASSPGLSCLVLS